MPGPIVGRATCSTSLTPYCPETVSEGLEPPDADPRGRVRRNAYRAPSGMRKKPRSAWRKKLGGRDAEHPQCCSLAGKAKPLYRRLPRSLVRRRTCTRNGDLAAAARGSERAGSAVSGCGRRSDKKACIVTQA